MRCILEVWNRYRIIWSGSDRKGAMFVLYGSHKGSEIKSYDVASDFQLGVYFVECVLSLKTLQSIEKLCFCNKMCDVLCFQKYCWFINHLIISRRVVNQIFIWY